MRESSSPEIQEVQTLKLATNAEQQSDTKLPQSDPSNWMPKGACVDKPTEVFYPDDNEGQELAKQICEQCPVKNHCLEYAVNHCIEYGVWGGVSEQDLRKKVRDKVLSDSREFLRGR